MSDPTDHFDSRPGNGFGVIRTNASREDLLQARETLRTLLTTAVVTSTSLLQMEPVIAKSGEVMSCRLRMSRDVHIEHQISENADPRAETTRRISVVSEDPDKGIRLTVHMARETCRDHAPSDQRGAVNMLRTVELACKAVDEAIAQSGGRIPEPLDERLVQGAAMFRDQSIMAADDDVRIMATGMSRLTPGMIRSGPVSKMENVEGACLSTPSLPAWTRLDVVVNDGSDGSRPEASIEIAELRIRTGVAGLSVADRMRAIAEWDQRRTDVCRMMTPKIR